MRVSVSKETTLLFPKYKFKTDINADCVLTQSLTSKIANESERLAT